MARYPRSQESQYSNTTSIPSGTTPTKSRRPRLQLTTGHNVVDVAFASIVIGVIIITSAIAPSMIFNIPVVVLGHFMLRTTYNYLPPSIPKRILEGFSQASLRSTLMLVVLGVAVIVFLTLLAATLVSGVGRFARKHANREASRYLVKNALPQPLKRLLRLVYSIAIGPAGVFAYRAVFDIPVDAEGRTLGAYEATVAVVVGRLVALGIKRAWQQQLNQGEAANKGAVRGELGQMEEGGGRI